MKHGKSRGIFAELYRYHYGVGLHTMRLMHRIKRSVARRTERPRRAVQYLWIRKVVHPVRRFLRGVAWLFPHHRPKGMTYFQSTREEWKMLGRIAGPVVGIIVLAVTLLSWVNAEYYLTVTYKGKELGVVENAEVYAEGAAMALERVTDESNRFKVDVPVFSMTIQRHQSPMSAEEVCDAILRASGDAITEAVGIYVDGAFIAAMESGEEMTTLLTDLKKEALKEAAKTTSIDANSKNLKVGFVQKVKMTAGLYPKSSLVTQAALRERLTAVTEKGGTYVVKEGDVLSTIAAAHMMTTSELRALNPKYADTDFINIGDKLEVAREQHFLQVKVIQTVSRTEPVKFRTKIVYRDNMYNDQEKVITKGKDGKQTVVREIVVVDGIEKATKVIERTVTQKAVTKVVAKGTKRRSSGNQNQQGDGVTHGSMAWPVPICHRVYQGYHSGHLAIDISSGPVPVLGKPAVAADGGVVIQAATGWNGGYGNVVKIQHSNGLITVYAHLQSVKVSTGQRVSRGQVIGLIGNTGYSFGPHLHFEVIRNGVKVNPLNYVRP